MIVNRPLGHLKISAGAMNDVISFIEARILENKKTYCIPLNLTKYVFAKNDIKLKKVINDANLIIPDGLSVVWLSRRLGYKTVHRVTGIDLAEKIISRASVSGWRLFFFGAESNKLEMAISKLCRQYPNLNITGSRHGYFTSQDIPQIIEEINSHRPDVLLLGLGMPQKEYFVDDYYNQLQAKFIITVGGAFDVWAGTKQRTPDFIQKLGFEWLYRSFYDKSKAYSIFKYGFIFLKDLIFLSSKSNHDVNTTKS